MMKTLSDDDASEASRSYGAARKASFAFAWEYFEYHAQQRQSAFRFYLLIVAAILASIVPAETRMPQWAAGTALVVVSFLFWRLDKRNSSLVKLAEDYLKEEELRLSSEVGSDKLTILRYAEERDNGMMQWVTSYSQVYRIIFLAISLIGIILAGPSGVDLFCRATSG